MVSFFLNEDLPNAQLFKIALHYHKKKRLQTTEIHERSDASIKRKKYNIL